MNWLRFGLLGICLVPLLSGCMLSRDHRIAMEEKDSQIRALNEREAQLNDQIQRLRSSLDSAHGELASASARTTDEPAAAPTPAASEKLPELDGTGITYGMRDGNMVLSIPSSITFASGEATLSKDGTKALGKVASTLKSKYPSAKYSIEGHTDTDPIKKSKFQSNRELSIERARAVHTWLVEDGGVPDANCIVVGYGEYDPVAANDTKENKARNRRVEIVVHLKKGK